MCRRGSGNMDLISKSQNAGTRGPLFRLEGGSFNSSEKTRKGSFSLWRMQAFVPSEMPGCELRDEVGKAWADFSTSRPYPDNTLASAHHQTDSVPQEYLPADSPVVQSIFWGHRYTYGLVETRPLVWPRVTIFMLWKLVIFQTCPFYRALISGPELLQRNFIWVINF